MWRSFVLVLATFFLGCGTPPKPAPAAVEVAAPRAAAAESKAADSAVTTDVWRIGAVLSLSGAQAQFGLDMREGIDLAVAQINARGGAAGRPVKILYRDDQGRPDTMKDAVRASIGDDHVLAILGENASSLTIAGGAVANEMKTPMLSPGSTGIGVTKVGEFVFAAIPSDDWQGTYAARYVRDLKKRRVAILSTRDDAYSSLVAGAFRAAAASHKATIVADVAVAWNIADLDPALATIQAARPDLIFAPVYYNVLSVVAPRAKLLGLAGSLFLGTDGWDSEDLWLDHGHELEGARFLNHWAPDAPAPALKAFQEAFRAQFGHAPTALSAMGFESMLLLADAIERSQTPTRQSVRDALAATQRFEGLLGPEKMGPDRRPNRPFTVSVIEGRNVRWAATIASP